MGLKIKKPKKKQKKETLKINLETWLKHAKLLFEFVL